MENFPVGIHVIFIPATLGVGVLLGWIIRGISEGQRRTRRIDNDVRNRRHDDVGSKQ